MPLILSDLHLGLSPLEITGLDPVLDMADELWLNGDTVETRHPRYRDRGERLWSELQRTCERRGLPIRRLTGNHDHDEGLPTHLELAAGRILVTHGHAFLPSIAPWSVWAREAERRHQACLASLPPSERGTLRAAMQAAASASEAAWSDPSRERRLHAAAMLTRPWAIAAVLRTWMRWPALAHAFTHRHRPEARLLVSGHAHRRGVHRRNGLVIMDTGSFNPPARAAAVRVRDHEACWIPLTLRRGRHEPAAESRWIRVSV
jgi:UDP-2,3-diacylglucosamine pyrophosphatase LpxH